MINYNGKLQQAESPSITSENRGFKFGDAIFETVKANKSKIFFWEDHYFRLMASMRMLRMKIPMEFTLEFLQDEIAKTINSLDSSSPFFRARLTVCRKNGGLYTPNTNEIDYIIEVGETNWKIKESYKLDVFKDFYNYSGTLSNIKTNNRLINTLASIYAKENNLDNCLLVNERKGVAEVANGNIFVVKGNTIKTPALSEGCIKGIARKKVIEILQKNTDYTLEENTISPFEIQKADEVFITNAIMGIQPVTQYKKKKLNTEFGKKLAKSFKILQITG
ncbi:aminotransferase class IV [Polaribacter sp.]|nr:aminotransferase class IV [Polaribacter sp.]